jgi:phospholipid/cholesterol/gamma-HCH transport system permease protein
MNSLLAPVRWLGDATLSAVSAVGRGALLSVAAGRSLRRVDQWGPHLIPQMVSIGVASIPLALFIAAFTGIVLAIQASYTFVGTVPLYFVGALVGKTIILELGPVLTGLALSGRVGASNASEIATMRVTEQIDALESLAYDPVAYLVVPRVIAGTLMFPVVIALAIAMGIVAGWLTSISLLDLATPQFVRGLRLFFDTWDVQFALFKAATFGATVTSVGAFFGYTCTGGARGVGRATTRTVVVSSMILLVLDAFWAATLL